MKIDAYIGLGLLIMVIVLLFINRNKIKAKLLAKYEREGIKIPNLSWSKRTGETFTEDVIVKRSRIPLIGDWGRIYPLVNENGKWNWINAIFGGKKNFIKTLLILGIVALVLIGFYDVFHSFELYRQSCIPKLNINP